MLRNSRKARIIPAKSEQSALREGDGLIAGDDEMVEHLDLDQRERLLQVARQELVRLARLRHARRMVVREDHRRRVDAQRRLDDLARVDAGLRQRAFERVLDVDRFVLFSSRASVGGGPYVVEAAFPLGAAKTQPAA